MPGQKYCSVYMKLAAPFVKAPMGHVTLFSCLWHLSLAVNHQLATSVNRARVFICEKNPPANRDLVSSPLSSRFAEARFSLINTNQLYTANQGRGGVSSNRGPWQSGAEAGYAFTYKQALSVFEPSTFRTLREK